MNKYEHDTVVPSQTSTDSKKEQIGKMFDSIALKYDIVNRVLSGGTDIGWRKKALKELETKNPKYILDVATGTADLALLAQEQLKPDNIIGIDISEGMLHIGRDKIANKNLSDKIKLYTGDSEAINYPDNTFDAVMVSFGVRNFENLEKGLSEINRVLKPNGKLVVLEFSQPKNKLFLGLYKFYNKFITPTLGKLFSKNTDAYQYLNDSINKFPEGINFDNILQKLNFKNTYFKPLSLGVCTIYCGEK